jgi:hypothetical protein
VEAVHGSTSRETRRVNDFVEGVGQEAGLAKSSAEGSARNVNNFGGASFLPLYGIPYGGTFGSFSFPRAKENVGFSRTS